MCLKIYFFNIKKKYIQQTLLLPRNSSSDAEQNTDIFNLVIKFEMFVVVRHFGICELMQQMVHLCLSHC